MTLKALTDFILLVDRLVLLAISRGIAFNERGLPIFKEEWFLKQPPKILVPYSKRHTKFVTDTKQTVICFYVPDKDIYPRLCNIVHDIPEYLNYMGIVMSDATITSDMDREWQDFIMLANLLYAAILATFGIKIIANLRTGCHGSLENLDCIPHNVMWAAGFLGCPQDEPWDMRFISSVAFVNASCLLTYGKRDANAEEKLSLLGIPYRSYPDYHKLCKGGR